MGGNTKLSSYICVLYGFANHITGQLMLQNCRVQIGLKCQLPDHQPRLCAPYHLIKVTVDTFSLS